MALCQQSVNCRKTMDEGEVRYRLFDHSLIGRTNIVDLFDICKKNNKLPCNGASVLDPDSRVSLSSQLFTRTTM